MKVEVLGKNGFVPSSANKDYCIKKLEKIASYFSNEENLEARVVCKVYKENHKVEITIPTKNLILRAEVGDYDLYAALDKAVDKLLIQVRKHKDKVKNKFDKDGIKSIYKEVIDTQTSKTDNFNKVVRSKKIDLVPMSLEDAMHQMDLLGHDFFIYLDEASMTTNVLYVRKDGGYALIET